MMYDIILHTDEGARRNGDQFRNYNSSLVLSIRRTGGRHFLTSFSAIHRFHIELVLAVGSLVYWWYKQ